MGDLYFYNGEIVTVDKHDSIAQAVVVKGNKILAVGSEEEVQSFVGPNTKRIDLQGKSLLPGFNDAHIHLVLYGVFQLALSCKEPKYQTLSTLLKDLKVRAQNTSDGRWVRAWGYNETKIDEQRYPTIAELDEVSSTLPVMIARTCGHICIMNSVAMKLAGIDATTPDPPGGIIEKDIHGNLTGRLIENASMQVNNIATYTEEELVQAMKIANEDFIKAGITSISEAGTFGAESFRVLQQAVQNKTIQLRIYALLGSINDSKEFVENIMASGIVTGTGSEWFKVGPAKLFTDGSSTGPTIATREPYTSDPNDSGILYYTEDEIYEVLGKAHRLGYQITVHAQGDKAIEMYLNCVERALNDHPRENHRHRIEHAGISTPDLQERMKQLNMIPIPNPPFPFEFGESYMKNYGDRTEFMYPAKDFIEQGIIAAAGSDAPVTHFNPLLGIHTAINRKTKDGVLFGQSQQVSKEQAIKMYTWNGAYASFEEEIKGSIEVGKLADLVILNDSILSCENDKIKDLEVITTIIDGEIVYEKIPQLTNGGV